MRITIFAKVALVTVFAILLTTIPILFTVNMTALERFDQEMMHSLKGKSDVVKELVKGYAETMQGYTRLLSLNDEFIKAVAVRDEITITKMIKEIRKASSLISTITVTDVKGNVIARAHDVVKPGDTITNQVNVQKAMKGETSVGCERVLRDNSLSLRGGTPVKDGDVQIGIVAIGITLSDVNYVASMSKLLDTEVTIFLGDTRAATTLKGPGGQSLVGTKLQDVKVRVSVLERNQEVHLKTIIAGANYAASYIPLLNSDGKVEGIFFMGVPRASIEQHAKGMLTAIAMQAAGISLLMMILAIVYAR
jgi:methyl-accepting chemotaxis protein